MRPGERWKPPPVNGWSALIVLVVGAVLVEAMEPGVLTGVVNKAVQLITALGRAFGNINWPRFTR